MRFAEPLFLVLGAAACAAVLWRARFLERARAAGLRQMASDHLVTGLTDGVSRTRRRIRLGLLLVGVAALFAALARPQAGFRWEEARRKGIDIMLALDTSKSMLARDVAPDRLGRAKLAILDFVEKLEGDRVGLIPFAGEAYLMCPLTLDYDAFRQSLETVDTEIVPVPGSDLANVIRVARKALDSEANHKILVLVTDGEDLEGEALAEAKRAAEEGVTIHAVGVGTAAGELVPDGAGAFLRDEKGELVTSRLDEKTLRDVSSAAGGLFERIGGGGGGLEAVYRGNLSLVPKEELLARRHKVPLERFEWALALGGLALLVEMIVGDRKRAWRLPRFRRAAAVAAVLLAASVAQASPQEAEKAFRAGEFGVAASEYRGALEKTPRDARLHQGLAASAYKTGDFAASTESYRRAIRTEDLGLQNEAYYGLGNALFREGQQALAKDPKQAIAKWEEALTQYDGALKLDPKDEDASFNRGVVQRKLEELRKQQEQKQQEQQEKQEEQQDQQQQSQQDRQNQQDQQQDSPQQDSQQQAGKDQQQQKDKQAGQDGQQQDGQQQGQEAGEGQQDRQQDAGQQQDPQQDGQSQQKDGQQAGHEGQQHEDRQQAGQRPETPKDGTGEKPRDDETKPDEGKPEGDPRKPRSRLDPGNDGKPDRDDPKQAEAKPKKGAPEAVEGQEPAGAEAGAHAAAGAGTEPREAGRMSREQARQLLDSLKEGEGRLAFVPQHGDANQRQKRHRRNW